MPALLVAFLAVPIVELYVIIQVAHVIGGWETLAVLILESVLGTWLIRREGRRTWGAFQLALSEHRPPGREVADGALVIVGGALLLTPGFLSDVVGFFVLLPLTRPLARRLLLRAVARRAGARFGLFSPPGGRSRGRGRRPPAGGSPVADRGVVDGQVVEGEVLDERPAPPRRRTDGTPPGP